MKKRPGKAHLSHVKVLEGLVEEVEVLDALALAVGVREGMEAGQLLESQGELKATRRIRTRGCGLVVSLVTLHPDDLSSIFSECKRKILTP